MNVQRRTVTAILMFILGLQGCGGTQAQVAENDSSAGINPESFVNCSAFEQAAVQRNREQETINRAINIFEERPCEMTSFDLPSNSSLSLEENIETLKITAKVACSNNLSGLVATHGSDGRLSISSEDGETLSNEYATFLSGSSESRIEVIPAEQPQSAEVLQACGDVFNGRPVHRVFTEEKTMVVMSGDIGTPFVVVDSHGRVQCPETTTDREIHAVVTPLEPGAVQRVYVGEPKGSEGGVATIDVRTDIHAFDDLMLQWTPGQTVRTSSAIPPQMSAANRFGPECYGNVPEDPAARVAVTEPGRGLVSASSEQDTVIAVIGPDGESFCNDDYDGLNPGVEVELTEGVWEIYVGAWSPQNTFSVDITIDSR